ncbi:hypothetical protein MYSTI_05789 [Myxococcus stipitatus DSM 14675]|uniref:Uncharacterized protein n=1 Tax=Myxococcus stipitatus (strain DSM 14675 / JCM 12634 / Mx s8) TaxID=1278073 RepID=L7UGS2_MYXSD|nr:PAAR-like domain-containing protein [Myxococcus stipitatus]AGC47065.1 hypothetical protein MYSTI_05789 [Myxococcus stipitatus DSM 14675]
MTKVSVNAPKTPVTEGSNGIAAATLPNICKMPGPPAPFVPTPLPNIGKSGTDPKGYSQTVMIEGKKVALKGASFGSMGDMASKGTGGGMISSNVEGPTTFAGPGSMNVKIEGKNVQLLGDPMLNNCGPSGSPANSATLMGEIQLPGALLTIVTGKEKCPLCEQVHQSDGELKETSETRADAKALEAVLVAHNQSEAVKKFPPGKNASGRMLGVVRCKCPETYTDHSSATESVFRQIVSERLGSWHAPADGSLNVSEPMRDGETGRTLKGPDGKPLNVTTPRVLAFTRKLCKDLGKEQSLVDAAWNEADLNHRTWCRDPNLRAAYKPGSCAGPKALALALQDKSYVTGMTELWFHRAEESTEGMVEHFRVDLNSKMLTPFGHGESVPPCAACTAILPLMLCTEGKNPEKKCQHKRKT